VERRAEGRQSQGVMSSYGAFPYKSLAMVLQTTPPISVAANLTNLQVMVHFIFCQRK
jgi:hypothetical protein